MIKIAHLYPYQLNLYGENGNVKALKYALEKEGMEATIVNIMEGAEINFQEYDFIYIGSGKKVDLERISKGLSKYYNDILDFIKKGKVFLITGNALALLKNFELYEVEECDERVVFDVVATTLLCNETIYGFQNTDYLIKSTNNVLFNMEGGKGNGGTLMEGYQNNNLYVTSIIGPILARNEKLTEYFVNLLKENEEK